MSTPASQLMLRHTRFFARKTTIRHASTTSEATQAASNTVAKSKEIASEVTSKASAGLSRVQSSAGPALSRVAHGINRTISGIGGRAGRLINFGTCECARFPLSVGMYTRSIDCYEEYFMTPDVTKRISFDWAITYDLSLH